MYFLGKHTFKQVLSDVKLVAGPNSGNHILSKIDIYSRFASVHNHVNSIFLAGKYER